jgi:hypothetical protein
MPMAMVFTPQKPTQRDRLGEIPEGLPGSTKSGVGVERSVKNLGGLRGSWAIQAEARDASARHTDHEPQTGKPRHRRRPEPKRRGERGSPSEQAG